MLICLGPVSSYFRASLVTIPSRVCLNLSPPFPSFFLLSHFPLSPHVYLSLFLFQNSSTLQIFVSSCVTMLVLVSCGIFPLGRDSACSGHPSPSVIQLSRPFSTHISRLNQLLIQLINSSFIPIPPSPLPPPPPPPVAGTFRPKAVFSQFENSSLNSELNFQIDTCVFLLFFCFFFFFLVFFRLFFRFVFFSVVFFVFFCCVFFVVSSFLCSFVRFFLLFSLIFFILFICIFWSFSFFGHFHFFLHFQFFFGPVKLSNFQFSIFKFGVRHQN